MSVSVVKIVDQVNSKIVEGGQNPIDTARLVGSVEAIESRYSVVNLAALPSAADNTGRFIYVEDIQAYRYSDGTQWTNDYDTTISETQLWSWGGASSSPVIGDGALTNRCSPVREFCSATDWCYVAAGGLHTAAVKTSGQLWAWGNNFNGLLGDGTTVSKCSPVRERCSATDWCQASTGSIHAAAVKTSGQLWAWGGNSYGRLGDGTTTTRCSPVREFCSAVDWCFVDVGTNTTAIKTSGQIWVWGYNTGAGRLGDGTTTPRCSPVREFCSATDWCAVGTGAAHVIGIKTSGQLWSWGGNFCGNLGNGTTVNSCSPVREICSATNWCQVTAGSNISLAIKTSGEMWAWGSNSNGQLGDGTITTRCSPVREISSATDWCTISAKCTHAAAVKTSGQIWLWGCNSCGQLGDGTTTNRCSPVREISSAVNWYQVSTGGGHTAAVKVTRGFNEP